MISIVSPCFNEVEGIAHFYESLSTVLLDLGQHSAEFVFVDDGRKEMA